MSVLSEENRIAAILRFCHLFDPKAYLTGLERKLERFFKHMPVSLVLPSLSKEIEDPCSPDESGQGMCCGSCLGSRKRVPFGENRILVLRARILR